MSLSAEILSANTPGKKAAARRKFNKLSATSRRSVKAHITRRAFINGFFSDVDYDWIFKNVMGQVG